MALKCVCGIDVDYDRTFISFAEVRRSVPVFIEEITFEKGLGEDFFKFLQENIEELRRTIDERAAAHSCEVSKIFIKIPPGMEKMCAAEEVVALKRTKKIAPADLMFAKKYLEDNALDWDDFCIHHFPLNFGIEGKAFESLPVGFWTKRLRMKSLLVTVKDRLRLGVADLFDTYDMPFGGFVSMGVSDFSASFSESNGIKAVINIGYESSLLTVVNKGVLSAVESTSFGLRTIVSEIESKFSLPRQLAQEIFDMYVSLGSDRSSGIGGKEVSVKDGDSYINLSISSVNALVKDCLKANIAPLVVRLGHEGEDVCLSFLGRLNAKEGFYEFLKSFVTYKIVDPQFKANTSSSFGCARYGVSRFLENIIAPRVPLSQRLSRVYKDYF